MGKGQVREIEWLIKKIKKKHSDVKILLFGSRARGDHLESSDYDLLILSDDFENVPFRKRLEEIYELVDRPANVEIICLTHKEFRERRNELSIIKEISRDGVVV